MLQMKQKILLVKIHKKYEKVTKDTVTLKIQTGKSTYQDMVGVQNILTGLKKGYETKPVCFRFIGNITDPSVLEKGDILVDGGNKFKAGITLEGIGNDATFNGVFQM